MTDVRSRRRVVLTFADQLVSSVSNFATGVAVARLAGAEQFGDYALVLMIWLVIVGVHRRVIAEPMIVASGDTDTRSAPIAQGLGAELLFGGATMILIAAGGAAAVALRASIGLPMLALAPWLIPLVVQDYWRAIAFQRRRPDLALINDVAFALVQVAAIVVFAGIGWRTAGSMITAWGMGALAGALLGFAWFPVLGSLRDGRRLLVELWPLGRWLLADFATSFASQQAYIAFAALLLTRVDYGGFRAATSLLGPTMVISQALGNIGVPEAARRARSDDPAALGRYVWKLSGASVVCVAIYVAFLAVASRVVLRGLYGPGFARYDLVAILSGVQYLVMVTASGQGIALRVTGHISQIWPLRIPTTILSLTSLVILVRWLGVDGSGWAAVATGVYDSLAVHLIYHRSRHGTDDHVSADGRAVASVWASSSATPVGTSEAAPT